MSQSLTSGQVAAADAAIYTNSLSASFSISAVFRNTSASLTETLVVSLTKSGLTERTLVRSVLAPNECFMVQGVGLSPGDALSATTTDASTVDYSILTGTGPLAFFAFDANGALKQVNTGVSGNQTVSGVLSAAGLTNTGVEVDSVGASTAAAGSTNSDAGGLPAGTAQVYPTTAANGTTGVIIDVADKVTGRKIFIGNGVGNAVLKIYPPSGGNINALGANTAYSTASGKGAIVVCLSSSGNTWLAMG